MTVWIVFVHDYNERCSFVQSVHSTEELAKEAVDEWNQIKYDKKVLYYEEYEVDE